MILQQDTCSHCVFYCSYDIVGAASYRFKVLHGKVCLRRRGICRQLCRENDAEILCAVLSRDHVSVPAKLAISDLMRRIKGRLSPKL